MSVFYQRIFPEIYDDLSFRFRSLPVSGLGHCAFFSDYRNEYILSWLERI